MIAALYIDPRGPYPKLCDWTRPASPSNARVDCWDATRDARRYAGPWSVVAHPPCKHWGGLRHLAKDAECHACDGTGFASGCHDADLTCCPCRGTGYVSDRDCAPRAVEQVRAFGGVLEHPAGSKLWEACGLSYPRPHELVRTADADDWAGPLLPKHDAYGGWCVELDQVEWGHVARKPTWLYLVGVPREALEPPPFPGRQPTHWCSGNRKNKNGGSVPPGIKICSAQQRRRTPPLFAEYLVRLARAAGQERSRYLAKKRAVEGRW